MSGFVSFVSSGPGDPELLTLKAVDRLHAEWRPRGLVVGDPMTLEGGDQPIRRRARAFAQELRARYALPVAMVLTALLAYGIHRLFYRHLESRPKILTVIASLVG